MLSVALFLVARASALDIPRDAYGVPHIVAPTWERAFHDAGYAVAQDRMWQLENSRRLARGRLAEVFGAQYAASDREVLKGGYTTAEVRAQLDALPTHVRAAYDAYADGVSAYIAYARAAGKLPPGFKAAGYEPEPWSVEDSAAIAIRMGQMFGNGGAGELRNTAVVEYLKGRPVKDKLVDTLDDLLWADDPLAIPTVPPSEDPLAKSPPAFYHATRQDTERHLAALPRASLFELLPGIKFASNESSKIVAESLNVPYKTGSYAVVVGSNRSALGVPLLLSAPQMGFRAPAVVHEMSIEAPGIKATGMDIPGIPGVIIGYTPHMAWGLTSGVADVEDIFTAPPSGPDGYVVDGQQRPIQVVKQTLRIKGAPDEVIEQRRTETGPILVQTRQAVYMRKSAFYGREMQAFGAMFDLYGAREPADVRKMAARIPLTFNLFYATTSGHIGYQYCGHVPLRAAGWDPRFPMPLQASTAWRGFVPAEKMPYVVDPKNGLIANWNNKPASWWPNGDTPAWGRVFRNESLLANLGMPTLDPTSLESAAWTIARTEETASAFMPTIRLGLRALTLEGARADAARMLAAYEGRAWDGSHGARIYVRTFDALREELFSTVLGGFLTPDLFKTALQPSLMLRALQGKTKVDYLAGRTSAQVVQAAFQKAFDRLVQESGPDPTRWSFVPSGISVPGLSAVPYGNRGTYIQIIELWKAPAGRNVLPPGVAESGPHSADQEPLSRAWTYKRMGGGGKD